MIRVIKYLFLGVFMVFAITSCSDKDKLTIQVQETVPRGAVLRTVSLEGASWDVLDPDATITIEIEEQDEEGGDLLSEVGVYIDLIDNTDDDTIDPQEVLFMTIPASDFEIGPFDLPRTTISLTQTQIASALGITLGEYNCGDQWSIRLDLQLTDGRSYTVGDAVGTVTGGSYFSSPYGYNISLVALLPSDELYTGQYQLTTEQPGIYGVADYQDGVYTIDALSNTTRVIRNITTFPAFGGFGPVDVEFQLVCGEIILTPGQSVGAGCNGSINSGPANTNATYDLQNPDDSEFLINFTSDEADDCGTGTAQASIRLTKV